MSNQAADGGVHGLAMEVDRRDLRSTRLAGADLAPPRDGEVLFEVERFAFSANNITYARLGEAMRYWDLFPAADGWGQVPVWGYLRAVSSAVPGITPGRRAFGLCPMATHVLMRPRHAEGATFTEGSAHRAGLSSAYNVYPWADGDPGGGAGRDPGGDPGRDPGRSRDAADVLMVLRPLFWLSYTLDDYLAERFGGDAAVVVTSASSKAAIGLARLLSRRGVTVTGLTSARHAAFVTGLSLYDQVLAYEETGKLALTRSVLADLAGDGALRDRIGRQLGTALAEVVVAGGTHPGSGSTHSGNRSTHSGNRSAHSGNGSAHSDNGSADSAPDSGITRRFFAPQRIRERSREWGWPVLEQRFAAALQGFADSAASWLRLEYARGVDGAAEVYRQVLGNAAAPAAAHVIDMTGGR